MHRPRLVHLVASLVFSSAALSDDGIPSSISADLSPDVATIVTLELAVDDEHLANPAGYFPAEPPATRVIDRVSVTNSGDLPLDSPVLRVDGRPYLSLLDPLDFLSLPDPPTPIGLYKAWTQHRVHGTTDLAANRHPTEVLRSIGATFCGDDTRALGRLLADIGIESRFAQMNGHSVAEYQFGDQWVLLDGDQNVFYLRLDNQTVASEADLLADPFLVLRNRIYGLRANWSAAHAWQNTSRFEFVNPGPQKRFRVKGDGAPTQWAFFPGETITFYPDRIPRAVIGANAGLSANETLRSQARLADFTVDLAARRAAGSPLRSPLPILSVRSGGEERSLAQPGDEPIFEIDLPPGDRATLICQVSAAFIPTLRSGENELVLSGGGPVRVDFTLNPAASKLSPSAAPTVQADAIFADGIPTFRIDGPAEQLWWQISDSPTFTIVPPNLDTLADFAPEVRIPSALDLTFLTPDRKHYFRARVRRSGVWSDWCLPVTFMVTKPDQPVIKAIRIINPTQVQLDFGDQDARVRVYGSNRLDFLPDLYSPIEPIEIENNRIVESRPNDNFLGEFSGERGFAVVALRRFYRLIARDGDHFSVPSDLAKLPPADNVPPATVLQNRHLKETGALTGVDRATERPVSGW